MAAGIDNRLTANAVNFVPQTRPQFPLFAMYDHTKTAPWCKTQIFRNAGKSLAERRNALVRRTKPLHGTSSLLEDAVNQLENVAKSLLRRRTIRR